MKVVVIGGTGLIGSKVVERLRKAGHEVVVGAPANGIDVLSGEGLDAALAGAQVVVDLANSPAFDRESALKFFQTAGQNLLAAEAKAGVGHHIALSVVGTQKLSGSGYFVGKAEQERLIRESGIPYTIIHSTQFFEFLPGIVKSGEQDGVVRLPTANVQPIASDDVADAVTRHALGAPVNGVTEIAGPERVRLSELAQRFLDSTKDERKVVGDPHALYFGVELQDDTLVPDGEAWHGELGFAQWLQRSDVARPAARG
ncbi:SDR family oxidoreductase [Lysobacter soli]|uniref:NAD-dependent epimerase/dehydratase family protein n=1 Tax=Lysobacter soli TaxID=453783 RepID=A0A3D8VDQ4_9GAMM|nr:SDR family oxidoreductase [Lysobacter soli]RDY67542.1 NAD-dependent epimerase/dehydratase family protein [Lysobacter soli]